MTTESILIAFARTLASAMGHRLFRNQVGLYTLADGRRLRSGLAVGSSDLIGWRTVTITPDMVGRRIAQFVAVEIKAPGTATTEEQRAFVATVRAAGGCAGIARTAEQVEALLRDDLA